MEKLVIKELYKNTENYINKEVTLEGWVRTVRDSKTFGFIEINDGTFFKNVQIVFTDKLSNFNSSVVTTGEPIFDKTPSTATLPGKLVCISRPPNCSIPKDGTLIISYL